MRSSRTEVEIALLEEGPRLRRFIRRLGADPSQVEDILQETALVALRSPPEQGWDASLWLRGVSRNLTLGLARRERSRRERERDHARQEATPSASQPLECRELTQRLRGALWALGVPYQEVLTLRYFEGISPAAIARELDLSINTVKARLRRALVQLRRSPLCCLPELSVRQPTLSA